MVNFNPPYAKGIIPYFYAGSKRLIEGDKATAIDYFKKCLVTGVKNFNEYQSAVAELSFLKTE